MKFKGFSANLFFSALIGKIADREKNNTGPKLTSPTVHRRRLLTLGQQAEGEAEQWAGGSGPTRKQGGSLGTGRVGLAKRTLASVRSRGTSGRGRVAVNARDW